jgi:hypothetical protein
MARELPLLIGSVGTVLGFFSLLGDAVFAVYYFNPPMSETGPNISLWGVMFFLAWTVSPFVGLAGAFTVKKRGKLGGLLFLIAGALPLLAGIGNIVFFFWTPPLIFAGIIAMLNWPGPWVDKEEMDETAQEASMSQP